MNRTSARLICSEVAQSKQTLTASTGCRAPGPPAHPRSALAGHQHHLGNWTNHNFYDADGNGNVTYLLNSSHSKVAEYRYDPFGNTISSSGSLATANVYRFSSKEIHVNSGLYYYGYRFYDPNLQRWPNRDPIGERGGKNVYRFVGNNPISRFDRLGLFSFLCDKCKKGNIRYVHAADFSLVPLINQGNLNTLDAAEGALSGSELIGKISSFGGVAAGLTAEELAKEVALAAADAGVGEGMNWNWSDAMVEALKTIQKMYGEQQGVEIAIKVLWQKCEETSTWSLGDEGKGGLPFTTRLDWVQKNKWHVSSAGVREEGGFDANDSTSIMRAIPFSVIEAIQTEVH